MKTKTHIYYLFALAVLIGVILIQQNSSQNIEYKEIEIEKQSNLDSIEVLNEMIRNRDILISSKEKEIDSIYRAIFNEKQLRQDEENRINNITSNDSIFKLFTKYYPN